MAPARRWRAIARYSSAENRRGATAYNTFGWTPVVSTNRTTISSQRPSTLCFAGMVMRLNATSIYLMFRDLYSTQTTSPTSCPGKRYFGRADGGRGNLISTRLAWCRICRHGPRDRDVEGRCEDGHDTEVRKLSNALRKQLYGSVS
jgi:hypothetical protein